MHEDGIIWTDTSQSEMQIPTSVMENNLVNYSIFHFEYFQNRFGNISKMDLEIFGVETFYKPLQKWFKHIYCRNLFHSFQNPFFLGVASCVAQSIVLRSQCPDLSSPVPSYV